jgi:pimeloyl-ACP methyl ester carboxylesterase
MILKSIFLARTQDWEFSYQREALDRFPNAAEVLIRGVKADESILDSLHAQLTSSLRQTQERAAISLSTWRSTLIRRRDLNSPVQETITDDDILKLRLYSLHEFRFARRENVNVLSYLHRLQEIPVFLVHGTDDLISPLTGAREADLVLPDGQLLPISEAGHSVLEPSIYSGIIDLTKAIR